MQRLIDAAKAVAKEYTAYTKAAVELDIAISDAERQAVDDALPITPEWMCELSGTQMPMIEVVGAVIIHMLDSDVYLNAARLPHITTRGQLNRLIAALKGGEA